jgi:hypothetical protein
VQSIHVYDPTKIIYVGGREPVKIAALINFISLNLRKTSRLDFNLHVVFRELLVRRNILVDDEVIPASLLINRPLDFDTQRMFIVANGSDLTSLPVAVEADNPQAGESDKRGS